MIPVRPAPTASRRSLLAVAGAALHCSTPASTIAAGDDAELIASGVALCCSAPVSAAAGVDVDDAELIAMGRELEALMPEVERRHERQTERIEAAHAAVVEDERWATADLAEQHELRTLYEDLHGVNDDEVDPEPLHLRLDEIRRRMEILPATTTGGLQAKAKLVAFRHGPFDEEAADLASLLRDLGVVRRP